VDKETTEDKILKVVRQIDQENFILANIVRMVYFAHFHKNEIINIRIGNIITEEGVVSEIAPFLDKTKRAYTSAPIVLDEDSKKFLDDHIKKLEAEGYSIDPDSPLFPDISTKEKYNGRTLGRHFKNFFKEAVTFNDLRKFGIQRRENKLKKESQSEFRLKEALAKFARHSRPDITRKQINGNIQKAGKPKRKARPWELIVESIEELMMKDKEFKIEKAKDIRSDISKLKEDDVKESLNRLLYRYLAQEKY
jgi:hypothetical protein